MDEQDLASRLQAGKLDSEEWGDDTSGLDEDPASAALPKAPKRRLAAMVSVRLSPEELEAVQARASQRGETVSAYLRGLAVREIGMEVWHLPVPLSVRLA